MHFFSNFARLSNYEYNKMKERNKAIFSLVYQLISADARIDRNEKRYLDGLANSLNLSQNDVKAIVASPHSYKLIPPPPENERMEILYYILFSMRIDGKISKEEEKIVYKAGLKLGFHEIMLKDMIDIMKKYLHTRLPADELIKIIRKYMN